MSGPLHIPAVCLKGVDFSYGRHAVLRAVDLDIEEGAFVSIVGPNGGGKTTLLRLMLGLLKPQSGDVHIFGEIPSAARRRIGYMPQHTNLDPLFPVTALDVVLMGRLGLRLQLGPFSRNDGKTARASLDDCEALDLADRPFADLSGGQRQRVLIARALAGEPDLLLLDEPTASLDPGVQDDLYELLHRLNKKMTVILVSHDVSVVSRHVRQVICVNVDVAQHPSEALTGELARLFPEGRRLVRHDHHTETGEHRHD